MESVPYVIIDSPMSVEDVVKKEISSFDTTERGPSYRVGASDLATAILLAIAAHKVEVDKWYQRKINEQNSDIQKYMKILEKPLIK